ncbi:hypothetical protein KR093_000625 [Drosophila rubida]|uniref:Uncharacterized protein n=1 Tax=Drosophila rubida TaxID=30044 RepID=A0AAD4JQS2_9MUSC|nr:hypothetical protein KR093_000625 [Drosophila rubida]
MYSNPSTSKSPKGGCECWQPDKKDCREVERENTDYKEEDLEDIATSLMKVMRLCRLRPWEVKRTAEVIKRAFRHYEEIRFRIDRVPKKRFRKENFMHDLAVVAGMGRMDGQLACGIVKRAFNAYYHGTGEGGIRLQSYADQMRHRSECLWVHAAKRTAEIFAIYAGLMYGEQLQYAACIECIYMALCKELQSRFKYAKSEPKVCTCRPEQQRVDSVWDALSGTTMISGTTAVTTELFFNKHTFKVSNPTSAVSIKAEYTMIARTETVLVASKFSYPTLNTNTSQNSKTVDKPADTNESETKSEVKKKRRRKKKRYERCQCPKLQCPEERPAPRITAECSQGPYVCRWVPYEDCFPEHRVPCPPMETICQPCVHDNGPCDDECTCTCQVCTCPPADEFLEEETQECCLSCAGLEDCDTDFCWLAPFRDEHTKLLPIEPSSLEDDEFGEEAEEQPFECRCTCEYKRRAFPHLFTHLEPFKDPAPKSEASEASEEEDVEPPPPPPPVQRFRPPWGFSMQAFRCWNEPEHSDHDEQAPICATSQRTSQQNSKAPPATKRQTPTATKSAPAVKPATATATAPAPAPAPAAASAPTTARRESDDRLTKEDILQMLGLQK